MNYDKLTSIMLKMKFEIRNEDRAAMNEVVYNLNVQYLQPYLLGKPRSNNFLRHAVGVDVGRVQDIAAPLDVSID